MDLLVRQECSVSLSHSFIRIRSPVLSVVHPFCGTDMISVKMKRFVVVCWVYMLSVLLMSTCLEATNAEASKELIPVTANVTKLMSSREIYLRPLLKRVVGIYDEVDKSKFHLNYQPGRPLPNSTVTKHPILPVDEMLRTLSSTVFVTVVSFSSKEGVAHYKVYLKNFICFANHHKIKLLLFIAHPDWNEIVADVEELEALGAVVAKYPNELLMQLIAEKSTPLRKGRHHVDYASSYASFKSHGALVMLVPVLEVLSYGLNVIFFDVDIGLVLDPVPFLLNNNVDWVLSQEARKCQDFYMTTFPENFHVQTLEPNTGIMFVRSNPQTIERYYSWLSYIVRDNVVNDQKMFSRKDLHLQYVHNCVGDHTHSTNMAIPGSFCFLSEVLFPNGLLGVSCPTKRAFHADWMLEMYDHGVHSADHSKRFPVVVHTNYCNSKSKELMIRGLWLLTEGDHVNSVEVLSNHTLTTSVENVCLPYNVSNTWTALMDWDKEVSEIRRERQAEMDELRRHNGTLIVKALGSQAVYFVNQSSFTRHLIPDVTVFAHHFGENWGLVRTIPYRSMMNMTPGVPLSEITVISG